MQVPTFNTSEASRHTNSRTGSLKTYNNPKRVPTNKWARIKKITHNPTTHKFMFELF
jgi:hypothetical protein